MSYPQVYPQRRISDSQDLSLHGDYGTGFKFDFFHFLPPCNGTKTDKVMQGVELSKRIQRPEDATNYLRCENSAGFHDIVLRKWQSQD